jgi:Fur family transcriptional regulator, ferric uptake regulator
MPSDPIVNPAQGQEPLALGQRQTRSREAVFGAIRSAKGPLTIPEIHAQAGKGAGRGKPGIATVYRTINLLLENDLIRAVVMPTGETRYESKEAGGHHHHHFKCDKCGKVFDLDFCPVGFPEGTQVPGGFRIDSHEVTFFGLCPECQAARKRK